MIRAPDPADCLLRQTDGVDKDILGRWISILQRNSNTDAGHRIPDQVRPPALGGAGGAVENAATEQACGEFDDDAGAFATIIEEGVELDQIER